MEDREETTEEDLADLELLRRTRGEETSCFNVEVLSAE